MLGLTIAGPAEAAVAFVWSVLRNVPSSRAVRWRASACAVPCWDGGHVLEKMRAPRAALMTRRRRKAGEGGGSKVK